jgi:hypothetical protein
MMDLAYTTGKEGGSVPLFAQLRLWFHLLTCPACEKEVRYWRALQEIMKTDFFPPAPPVEEFLMERLEESAGVHEALAPAGFSLRLWVLIGCFVLISLGSSFFGMNFIEIANTEGQSFLLPVGITIGVVLTGYGALFIASHLEELTARFHLH